MRVYVEAYGCSQNHGEAEELRRALGRSGHVVVPDLRTAEAGVLVTCGVIGSTEDRMVRRWEALSARIPRMVVTGCLVPLRVKRFHGPALARTTFVRITEQPRLPELLVSAEPAGSLPPPEPPASGPAVEPTAEVVIAQGCTSRCSYCFSRLARGRLTSRPLEDVVQRVRAAVARGAVEVRLSSLDTSCWGADLGGDARIPDLVRAAAEVPGTFRLRVGMASPQTVAPISERLFEAMAHDRVFHFLHLPVQSGSDRVLSSMERGYTVSEVHRIVRLARSALPDLMLATDVIVGFPGESEGEFDETLSVIAELAPQVVNVTRYSPRPYTRAGRETAMPPGVVKRRSRKLTELRLAVARERMERWIGWTGPALLVEAGRDATTVARLPNYLPVVLDGRWPLGRAVSVRVYGARSTYLLGRPDGAALPQLGVAS